MISAAMTSDEDTLVCGTSWLGTNLAGHWGIGNDDLGRARGEGSRSQKTYLS